MVSVPEDPTGVDFRLRNVRAGVALSVFCCAYLLVYCAVTWDRPHRDVLVGLAVYSVLSSTAMLRLPLEPVMRHSRWREVFFMSWSALLILFVTVIVLVDGGVSSPAAAIYFLPLVFAALSYPVASMIAVAVLDIAGYVIAAVAGGGVSPTNVAFVALTLFCASWMCAWQARIHERHRHELRRLSRADALTGAEPARLRRARRRRAQPRRAGRRRRRPRPAPGGRPRPLRRQAGAHPPRVGGRARRAALGDRARPRDRRRHGLRHEHSLAVARCAVLIGQRLGLEDATLRSLRFAAILHDVGKIAVPEEILRRPEPLTAAERALVERHPVAGAEMVQRIDGLGEVVPWVRHSHEHVDGSGYPDGLAGDDIPFESRILLVADAFDAMRSARGYSPAMTIDEALAELRRGAGRPFDPACVDWLCAALSGDGAGAVDDVVALV